LKKDSIIPNEVISNKIYFIRNQKVMLYRDLAELYDVKSTRLREQVKRNFDKFPKHFMFRLSETETDFMVSQNAIPSKKHLGGSLPYVFTEHGILQLSNVIQSKRAIQMSIKIIEIFIQMREILSNNLNLKIEIEEIKKKLSNHSKNIELVFNYLDELIEKKDKPRNKIGYKK